MHMIYTNVNIHLESQNHTTNQVGRNLRRCSSPTFHVKNESRWDYLAPCLIIYWKTSSDGDSTTPLGRLFTGMIVLMVKNFFFKWRHNLSQWNCICCPFPSLCDSWRERLYIYGCINRRMQHANTDFLECVL